VSHAPELATIQSGLVDDNPNMDTSPDRSDCMDHFRTAQDRTIDFSDTTGSHAHLEWIATHSVRVLNDDAVSWPEDRLW
jgi:hypothetical protein